MSKYSIVVPVYNEELIINETYTKLRETIKQTNEDYELIFVNDGSTDSSYKLLASICENDDHIKLLNLSRNFGHQVAISAGLDHATGDAIIVIDADLQDPPEIILEMIKKWKEGFEIVHGKRIKREGDRILKKIAIYLYYRFLKCLTSYEIPIDVGDFRLIDKKVLSALQNLPEKNRYLRGLISWLGFNQTFVEYIRQGRIGGESKYSLSKLFGLAVSGITSFSYTPLRFASYIGLMLSTFSLFLLAYLIFLRIFNNIPIAGWTSLIVCNLFFFGTVLLILGIIGEYIAKIYEETKGRPIYILKEKKGFK